MTEPALFRPLSLDQLFALDLPEPEWLVEGLLPLGAAGLLSAREKAGKGLLTIDLCACVALGEPFLDRAVVEGAAIYCAAEENVRDVRQRIAARLGDRRDAPLYVLPLDGSTEDRLKLEDLVALAKLAGMVEAYQPVLMVLDTLRELHDGQEDASDDMTPRLRPVRQLAHQSNTTIIVNHHMNRGGSFRGSTAIRAAFDLEWSFTRTDDGDTDEPPRGALRVEGRHGPRHTSHIRLGEGMHWEPATAPATPGDVGMRPRILTHLRTAAGWQTAEEIAGSIEAAKKTVQNTLAQMVKEVPRPVAVDGAGTKNAPRRYHTLAATFAPEMIPPDGDPLGGRDGGNHWVGPDPFVPDGSRTNGNHAGNNGRGCVECGAALPSGASFYCARHRGPLAAFAPKGDRHD